MAGGGLAVVEDVIDGEGNVLEGDGVAAVLVVVGEAADDAEGALAEVAAHPGVGVGDGDGAVVGDFPVGVVDDVGGGGDGFGGLGPGVAFVDVDGDADAFVELAVLAGVPGGDDALLILDGGVGVVVLEDVGGLRGRREGKGRGDGDKNGLMDTSGGHAWFSMKCGHYSIAVSDQPSTC